MNCAICTKNLNLKFKLYLNDGGGSVPKGVCVVVMAIVMVLEWRWCLL